MEILTWESTHPFRTRQRQAYLGHFKDYDRRLIEIDKKQFVSGK